MFCISPHCFATPPLVDHRVGGEPAPGCNQAISWAWPGRPPPHRPIVQKRRYANRSLAGSILLFGADIFRRLSSPLWITTLKYSTAHTLNALQKCEFVTVLIPAQFRSQGMSCRHYCQSTDDHGGVFAKVNSPDHGKRCQNIFATVWPSTVFELPNRWLGLSQRLTIIWLLLLIVKLQHAVSDHHSFVPVKVSGRQSGDTLGWGGIGDRKGSNISEIHYQN